MADRNVGKKVNKRKLPERVSFTPVLHKKQREMWNDRKRFQVIASGRRFGKALCLTTPILLSDFTWTTVGELKEGDWIFDETGSPVEIIELHGVYSDRSCYRLHFDNGDSIVADKEHDWVVDCEGEECGKKYTTGQLYNKLQLGYTIKLPAYILPIHKETNYIHKAKYIVDIVPVESVPVKCITVDNESHLFLAGRSLIPTHNSIFAAYRVIQKALQKPDSVNWVIAPTFTATMLLWRKVIKFLPEELIEEINRSESVIYLVNGAEIWAKSAERPEGLRGEGLDFIVMDEAAFIKPDVWSYILRPALSDKKGGALIIGTPAGLNYYYDLFMRGIPESETYDVEWSSFNCSSWDNPILDRKELEELKRTLPPMAYLQEIEAQFIDSTGIVFTGIPGCIREGWYIDPIWDHLYLIGVDLAKYNDYTVITVFDVSENTVVYWERFNQIDWSVQKERIREVAKVYNNPQVVMDSTGVGDPIAEDLMNSGMNVLPFKFNTKTKPLLVQKLIFMINNYKITFPKIEELVDELQRFTFTLGKDGKFHYAAPLGKHDDTVMSLALAVYYYDHVIPSVDDWDYT